MQIKRNISKRIQQLADTFPAVVLTGARQTGKTTLLKSLFSTYSYVSLDLPAEAEFAETDPEHFLTKYPPPVLIDEVQYAPKLFRYLKIAIDAKRHKNGQFILTGSQKFTLMKEVSESLAGRVAIAELETLSFLELPQKTQEDLRSVQGLAQLLTRGLFPQLWAHAEVSAQEYYRSYLATYLERDVRQLINIVSLRDFDRFLRICATRNGNLVNKTDLARDVGISPNTASQWLSVLEASNQIILLEPYYGNVGKRIIKSPKLYFADTGLLCFLLGLNEKTILESPEIGAIWETFIFSELRKYKEQQEPEMSIYFYRDQQAIEVDFLIMHNGKLDLLEAKWTETPGERDYKNILKVADILGNKTGSKGIVCRTSVPRKLDKIDINIKNVFEQIV